MKRSKFTEEQITYVLRQHEAGTAVADICRQLGVSEATFYVWKKKYANLGVSRLRIALPGRVAPTSRRGDLQDFADRLDPIGIAVLVDVGVCVNR